jgi:mannose-6-phosphate isomerase
MFVGITNTARDYSWGSRTAIPELLGTPPTGEPEAEVWLGAHPGSPAVILDPSQTAGAATLAEWIAADPATALHGFATANLHEGEQRLPFLMKVLAAASPLSLQAHPTPEQARAGFEREEAAGVPIDAPFRNYKDAHPKPELMLALSDTFEALCGFRSVADVRASLEILERHDPSVAALRERLVDDADLPAAFEWLISRADGVDALVASVVAAATAELADRPGNDVPADDGDAVSPAAVLSDPVLSDPASVLSDPVLSDPDSSDFVSRSTDTSAPAPAAASAPAPAAASAPAPAAASAFASSASARDATTTIAGPDSELAPEFATVLSLAEQYPGDPGIVISLLINRVSLRRGEVLYLPAGNIHAYLDGLGIEVMASSDNVLRGGLTPKHVDIPELLSVLDFTVLPVPYLPATELAPGVAEYRPDVPDFVLVHVEGDDRAATVPLVGPAIVLCLSGSFDLAGAAGSGAGNGATVTRGEAVYVTPDEGPLLITGSGELVLATTGA